MNTFAIGSLPVHFSVAKLFTFRWQYTYVEYCVVVNGKKITDSLILSPGTRRTIYFDSKDFKVVYVKAKVYIG